MTYRLLLGLGLATCILSGCATEKSETEDSPQTQNMTAEQLVGRWGGYMPLLDPSAYADEGPPLFTEDGLMVYGLELYEDNRFLLTTIPRGWYGDWKIEGNTLNLVATGSVDHDRDEQYLPEFEDGQTMWMIDTKPDQTMEMYAPPLDMFASDTMKFRRLQVE